jgi:hypothetical protein
MPQERGIGRQRKLNRPVIQLAYAFNGVGKLQAVEIREAAVNVMPRMVAVKDTPEGKDHHPHSACALG